MDRFVIREPRNDKEHMQQNGNRIMDQRVAAGAYPSNTSNTANNYLQSEIYHGGYGAEYPGSSSTQHGGGGRFGNMSMMSMGGMGGMGGMGSMGQMGGGPQMGLPMCSSTPMLPDQSQMMSNINHNQQYLATYVDDRATIVSGQSRLQNEQSMYNPNNHQMVTGNYNYRTFSGPEGVKTFVPQMVAKSSQPQPNQLRREDHIQHNKSLPEMQKFTGRDTQNTVPPVPNQQNASRKELTKQSTEVVFIKNEHENPVKSRFDKLKELHRSGPRAFSGPVEKVLKWHKSLQDLGLLIIYEVVAKCVSVRQGEWCSKHLVIRDDQGPAMQVVYYEVDFLLPELKPPCTIRVVGRMVAGTSRLHAFTVRPAAGDDVATLPRRAAVAAHHVAKLCSQYCSNAV